MKKVYQFALLCLCAFSGAVLAAANDLGVDQRNTADNGWLTRTLTIPSGGANGIMGFNGTTVRPLIFGIGAGLSVTGGNLVATAASQVNADWNASSGVEQILNKPVLSAVATSGDYVDLMNRPTLAAVATSGAYVDLSGRPSLSTVATSGSYTDLTNKPSIPAAQVNADWSAVSGFAQILNKPSFATVATTGAYSDLSGRPTIPAAQVNSDWAASTGLAQILNKPTLSTVATSGAYSDLSGRPSLATVATSGAYADLTGKPSIPAAQVQTDWNAVSGMGVLLNKPSLSSVATTGAYNDLSGRPALAAVATSGAYTDLTGRPTLATVATSGAYSDLSGRPSLATVATSGSYNDLSNKPTIPTALSFSAPSSRSLSLATAYQCTDNTKPCILTITLQSQSSVSLSGAVNNEGAITIGSTNAVASGTGTNVAVYKNNLGGTLVVGLNLSSQQANTYTIAMPIGYYLAIRQTAGSGLQVVSTFEQTT